MLHSIMAKRLSWSTVHHNIICSYPEGQLPKCALLLCRTSYPADKTMSTRQLEPCRGPSREAPRTVQGKPHSGISVRVSHWPGWAERKGLVSCLVQSGVLGCPWRFLDVVQIINKFNDRPYTRTHVEHYVIFDLCSSK